MQVDSKACFCSESRRHKLCLDVLVAKVHGYDHSQTVYLFPSQVRAIRGTHQHRTAWVDNEMLVLLVRNKKSGILNVQRRLEWSCLWSN